MITLKINGEDKTFEAPDDMPLLWVLRGVVRGARANSRVLTTRC